MPAKQPIAPEKGLVKKLTAPEKGQLDNIISLFLELLIASKKN